MVRETTQAKYEEICKMYGEMREKGVEEMYKELKEKGLSAGSIKNIMCAIRWKYKESKYEDKIKEINKGESEKRKGNTNRFAKIKWEEIEKPTGHKVTDVIKGLYTMFPPRRVEDYVYMRYIERDEEIGEDNYYKKGGELIFKRYKTAYRYGVQKFGVSEELKELIEGYIKEMGIKSGEVLMQYNGRRGKCTDITFRDKVKKIFGVSVDGIRHAYITNLYKNPENLYKISEISEKMAHSIGMHIMYLDRENK